MHSVRLDRTHWDERKQTCTLNQIQLIRTHFSLSFGTSVFHPVCLQEVGCIIIVLNHKNNRISESEQLDERIPLSEMKGFGRHFHQQSAHAEMAVLNLCVYTDIHTQYITLYNLRCLRLPLPSVETAWAA